MKNRFLILLLLFCLFLSSCFDIEETYNIKQDGSYTLGYNLDLGRPLRITNLMMPDTVKEMSFYQLKKDTLFNLAALPDSLLAKLNKNELNILRQTQMRTSMDLNKGLFEINVNSQGKSVEELRYFLANFNQSLQKSKVSDIMMGGKKSNMSQSSESLADKEPELPFQHKEYDYIVTANSFERKIRPEVLLAAKEKNTDIYEMMKEMEMKMKNTIVINLPRPAISVENSKAVLSADKRQFKLVIDMIEAMAHPESLNFKVTY
jgi:hypothetical protein